ncbi:hydantoinase/oxoprolinase family protein [Pseudooceanicola sp. 502str34]
MTKNPHIRVGIDIGGTFTDLQFLDETTGQVFSAKTPTTPEDPSVGLINGLRIAAERYGFELSDIRLLLHGTTIATNAVLERKMALGVLVTTAGFEDVLEIGRHTRPDIFSARQIKPDTLIRRDRRFGVSERMRADGSVERPLDAADVEAVAQQIEASGAQAIAISLLNSYINPAHERELGAMLEARFPGMPVSLSCDVSPEIREFERTSTTALNALLMPVVGAYLDGLGARLKAEGVGARLLLVQSNGGVCSAQMAKNQPARLLLSGPSGGALATRQMAGALERPNLIGVDMGGTSFDVCVVKDGDVTAVTQSTIDGLPVRMPMIEIRTIGSGGGSIAAVDDAGRLRVGPHSAGSTPGPVCYGRGGTEPTVTDANLAMGRLDPRYFLGGKMALDLDGCRAAIADRLGAPLNLSLEEVAEGMMKVTNTSLATAARLSLFEKGLDPRDFTVISFGGAGGLHAIEVAEELGVDEVIFPPDASTFSAYGILHSDLVHNLARSRMMICGPDVLPVLAEMLEDLTAQGAALLDEDGVPEDRRRFQWSLDLRYRGQASELVVPWDEAAATPEALEQVMARFHADHRERFSYSDPKAAVELVALRLAAVGALSDELDITRPAAEAGDSLSETRPMLIDGAWHDTAVHRRPAISGAITGPALVEEEYTTILLRGGWTCEAHASGALIATRSEGAVA